MAGGSQTEPVEVIRADGQADIYQGFAHDEPEGLKTYVTFSYEVLPQNALRVVRAEYRPNGDRLSVEATYPPGAWLRATGNTPIGRDPENGDYWRFKELPELT